jgi:hypothetical protein
VAVLFLVSHSVSVGVGLRGGAFTSFHAGGEIGRRAGSGEALGEGVSI